MGWGDLVRLEKRGRNANRENHPHKPRDGAEVAGPQEKGARPAKASGPKKRTSESGRYEDSENPRAGLKDQRYREEFGETEGRLEDAA